MEQGSRLGPLSGVLFAVLILGVAGVRLAADAPAVRPDDSASAITAYVADERGTHLVLLLLTLGAAFVFVWFLTDLRHRLDLRLAPEDRWVTGVFWAGGLLLVAGLLIQALVLQGLAVAGEYRSPEAASALLALSWGQAVVIIPGIATLMATAMLLSLYLRVLPGWLAAVAAAGFLGAALPWIPVFSLWILAVSVALLLQPDRAAAREDAVA